MSFNVDNMLSIGSIVKIRSADCLVMVIGYSNIQNNTIYDYIGCVYPVGILDSQEVIIFNSNDVKEVVEKGYSNENTNNFKEKYIKTISEIDNIETLEKNQKELEKIKDNFPERMQINRLLPIGSVVKIKKDSKHKFMITSNFMERNENEMYDYMAALYPVGIYSFESNYFFNDEDITDIYYFGYCDDIVYVKRVANQCAANGKNLHI